MTKMCYNLIEQPAGGFLPANLLTMFQLNDDFELYPESTVSNDVLDYAVIRVYQFLYGQSIEKVYHYAAKAARMVGREKQYAFDVDVVRTIDIDHLSRTDVRSIFRLALLEEFLYSNDSSQIGLHLIGQHDVHNLSRLIQRLFRLVDQYGPVLGLNIILDNESMNPIQVVTAGAIWDIDCSDHEPDPHLTLKLLCQYLMYRQTDKQSFGEIHSIGLFNPYLNTVYLIELEYIDEQVISDVEFQLQKHISNK